MDTSNHDPNHNFGPPLSAPVGQRSESVADAEHLRLPTKLKRRYDGHVKFVPKRQCLYSICVKDWHAAVLKYENTLPTYQKPTLTSASSMIKYPSPTSTYPSPATTHQNVEFSTQTANLPSQIAGPSYMTADPSYMTAGPARPAFEFIEPSPEVAPEPRKQRMFSTQTANLPGQIVGPSYMTTDPSYMIAGPDRPAFEFIEPSPEVALEPRKQRMFSTQTANLPGQIVGPSYMTTDPSYMIAGPDRPAFEFIEPSPEVALEPRKQRMFSTQTANLPSQIAGPSFMTTDPSYMTAGPARPAFEPIKPSPEVAAEPHKQRMRATKTATFKSNHKLDVLATVCGARLQRLATVREEEDENIKNDGSE